jgi:Flp pilus assembly pilin Flp
VLPASASYQAVWPFTRRTDIMTCRLPIQKLRYTRAGQSLVEYVILLAVVAMIVVMALQTVGKHSQANLQAANNGFDESQAASSTSSGGKGKPAHGGHHGKPGKGSPGDDND